MSDDIYTINLNGAPVSPGALAQIGTALEMYGSVKVTNAAQPNNGPGIAAMILGSVLKKEGKK